MANRNEDAMEIDSPSQNQAQPNNTTDSMSNSNEGQRLQKANEPPPNPPPESTTPYSDVSRQANPSHEPSTAPSSPLVTSSGSPVAELRGSSGGYETRGPVGNRGTRGQASDREERRPASRELRRPAGREPRGPASGRGPRGLLSHNELMEELNRLTHENHHAAKTINKQKHDNELLETELAKLESYNESLKSEIVGLRGDLKAIKADLIQSNDKNRTLKNAIVNMHASNPNMITDVQISKDYQYLISQIKNWAFSHFCGATPKHTKKTIAGFGIESDSDNMTATAAREYLKEDSKRRFLVIGMLVMQYLNEHIFRKFLFGLADSEERCLGDLGEDFEETAPPKGVRFWYSTTAQMISATEGHRHEVQERKKELVVQLESILVDTIPLDGVKKDRVDDLKMIVDQAADLALTLSVQRAKYFLYSPPPGKPFTPYVESAEDNEEGGGSWKGGHGREKVIGLTVFPGLLKKGNEDGEKLDQIVFICNAKALQKAPEKGMISRGLGVVGLSRHNKAVCDGA